MSWINRSSSAPLRVRYDSGRGFMLDELKHIKSDKKKLREFGLTIGSVLLILGGIAMWRGRATAHYLFAAGAAFIVLGLTIPFALKPLQKLWMGLGIVLGFFVSRVILLVLFYGMMTPIGFIMKLLGKDLLDERIDKTKTSYWHERDIAAKPRESYENQY